LNLFDPFIAAGYCGGRDLRSRLQPRAAPRLPSTDKTANFTLIRQPLWQTVTDWLFLAALATRQGNQLVT
jgi:hypothetical protein